MSLQEYMAFMISRETENVQSAHDVEAAFRALTSSDKAYITAQELYAVSTRPTRSHQRQQPTQCGIIVRRLVGMRRFDGRRISVTSRQNLFLFDGLRAYIIL